MTSRDLNESMWEDIATCSAAGRADDLFPGTSKLIAIMKSAGLADDVVRSVLGWKPDFEDCMSRAACIR